MEPQASKIPGFLAIVITIGFMACLLGLLSGWLTSTENPSLLILIGALGAAWGSVINYYFGSTSGSSRKTELLSQQLTIPPKE